MNDTATHLRRAARLHTPTDLGVDARRDVSGALNALLADLFALYLKTKNFHWHVSGPHLRDYHLLLDEQADQIFATTDVIAERVRKIGATTLRSIAHIGHLQRVQDNDAEYVTPLDMLAEFARGQRGPRAPDAGRPRSVRRTAGCSDGQPLRNLDQRGGAADLVPVRSEPPSGDGGKLTIT